LEQVTMENSDAVLIDRMLRPLCRRHLLVLFDALPVRVKQEGGEASDRAILWALGVLTDGQHEVMGAWAEECGPLWPNVLADLVVRGAEQVKLFVSADSDALRSALEGAYPNATVLPAGTEVSAFDALSPRPRRALHASYDTVRQLRFHADRAIGRHGCFASLSSASAFVIDVLARAERRTGVVRASTEIGPERLVAAGRRKEIFGAEAQPL
jgi:hypothetical protein